MATSATTSSTAAAAATSTFPRHHPLSARRNRSGNYISFATRTLTRKLSVRNSASEGSSSSPAETTSTATEVDETEIEVPEEPPSLISALNVEKALRGIAITEVDHYRILGLQRGCPYDQVKVAYDKKVEEVMKEGLEQEELSKKLQLLKESYSILSSVQERRLYDWSLARSGNLDRYAWPFEVDITQTPNSPDTPPPQEPEDVGPTRLVGYFFLGWIILAFTLSIVLNRS